MRASVVMYSEPDGDTRPRREWRDRVELEARSARSAAEAALIRERGTAAKRYTTEVGA